MYNTLKPVLQQELADIENAGLYKRERIITSPQGAEITVQGGKEVVKKIAEFLGTEDTILYAAAFDANGGVFEPLFNEQDAIISDELNHASIIDGVRLCKAQRLRYKHDDMADLEEKLKATQNCRHR